MDEQQVEQEIRGLFGLPAGRFIEARTDLERRLRADGDAVAARRVKALRRPSLAAWALNQLARQKSKQVDEVIQLGEELRAAERRALSGTGGASLQEAGGRWRQLVERLTDAAEQILEAAGHSVSRSHLDQVQNTLLATATDETVRDQFREGTLEKEAPPPSGFGGLDGAEVGIQPSPRETKRTSGRSHAPADRQDDRGRPDAQARKRERVRQRAEELDRQATEAEAEARRLRQEFATAEERSRKARAASERASAKAKTARDRAVRTSREAR